MNLSGRINADGACIYTVFKRLLPVLYLFKSDMYVKSRSKNHVHRAGHIL